MLLELPDDRSDNRPVPSINRAMLRARDEANIESLTLDGDTMLVSGKIINRIRLANGLNDLPEFEDDTVYWLSDGCDIDIFEDA